MAPCLQIHLLLTEGSWPKVLLPVEEELINAESMVWGQSALQSVSHQRSLQPPHLQSTIQIKHSHSSDTSNQHQLQQKWICSDFVIFKHHTPQSPGSRHLLPHQGCMTCYTSWAPGAKHYYRKPPMPTSQPTCMPGAPSTLMLQTLPPHSPINFCLRWFHYITSPSWPTSPSHSHNEVIEYTKALAWNVVLPLGPWWFQCSASLWDGSHHGP